MKLTNKRATNGLPVFAPPHPSQAVTRAVCPPLASFPSGCKSPFANGKKKKESERDAFSTF